MLNLWPDLSVLSVAAMGSTFQCLGCLPCECCPGHLQQGPWAWKGGSYSQREKTLMPCSIEWILKWLQLLRVYLQINSSLKRWKVVKVVIGLVVTQLSSAKSVFTC